MEAAKLSALAAMCGRLLDAGRIRGAAPNDQWLAGSEKAGSTPFAYTLPNAQAPKHPIAIILAPRFFEATDHARAATLIHEMGHWKAFEAHGASTEYDGYKIEYDNAAKIGLSEKDGLTYFSMLDGVVEYVVPRDPRYAGKPDVKAYIEESNSSEK
jgi:hypothetical protein